MSSTPTPPSRPAGDLLGRFLRERRARITVEEAGLPARRSGRGATSLTQEDLARLTGYSIRTISALEQGSEHRPSRELLDAITEALRLRPDEQATLWYLAVGAPPPVDGYTVNPDPGLARLVQLHDPHPSCLYDEMWNVLSFNTGFAAWVSDFAARAPADRNLARYTFCDQHARHILVEWEREFAPEFMGRIRVAYARRPDDQNLAELIEELCARSPYAKRLWQGRADPYFHPPSVVRLMRPPGHTDPDQADDSRYHVPVTWTVLSPTTPGDNRRLVVLLLPDEYPKAAPSLSAQPCTACEREVRDRNRPPRPAP